MVRIGVALALVMLCGCAGYSRVTEYPAHLPKNIIKVEANGQLFLIKEHPRDKAILIQVTMGKAAEAGLLSAFTFTPVRDIAAIEPSYRAAAEVFARHAGCKVVDLYSLGSVSYEAKLDCAIWPPKVSD